MDSPPMRGDGSSRELSHTAGVKMLADLLARVEAADGPDRELDTDIEIWKLGDAIPATAEIKRELCGRGGVLGWSNPPDQMLRRSVCDVPKFTASLDAALALVERVLPGLGVPMLARAVHELRSRPDKGSVAEPPRALIAALLRALIAQAEASPTGQSAERQPSPRDELKNPIAKGAGE